MERALLRVQVSINGQRFEMSMDVATTVSELFRIFFITPLDAKPKTDESANSFPGLPIEIVGGKTEVTFLDLFEGEKALKWVEANPQWVVESYYRDWVAPKVRSMMCSCSPSTSLCEGYKSLWKSLQLSQGTAMRMIPLSPWMAPHSISFQREKHVWVFTFPPRITLPMIDSERLNTSVSTDWWMHLKATYPSMAFDPVLPGVEKPPPPPVSEEVLRRLNEDPMLLLQSEFVGGILVFLRKLSPHLLAAPKPINVNDAVTPATGLPSFPLRWSEMTDMQQTAIRVFIQIFGIVVLAPLCFAEKLTPPALTREAQSVLEEDSSLFPVACGACGTIGHEATDCPFTK